MNDDVLMGVLGKFAAGGWSDLDNAEAFLRDQRKTISAEEQRLANEQAAIAKAALSTDAGKALLEFLLKKTILRGPGDIELGASTVEAYALAAKKREGQNSIVFMLLGMLQHTTDKPAPGGEL